MSGYRIILILLIAILAMIACGLSAYLTWASWNVIPIAGCGGGSAVDCDVVLGSRWSKWLGIPVSLFGLLSYVAILVCCALLATAAQGLAMTGLLALGLMAAGAALWFFGLQAFVLQSFCLYCLAVHSCGLTIGVLAFWLAKVLASGHDYVAMQAMLGTTGLAPSSNGDPSQRVLASPLLASAIAGVGIAMLLGGQLLFVPEALVMEQLAEVEPHDPAIEKPILLSADEPSQESSDSQEPIQSDGLPRQTEPDTTPKTVGLRRLQFPGLSKPVDLNESILLGDPSAKHVIVEMFDYTCRHCREIHPRIRTAMDAYEGQLAVVLQPTPLAKECNPFVKRSDRAHRSACTYATLALGVWRLAPDRFLEFHEWLMDGKNPPPEATVRWRALEIASREILTDQQLSFEISSQIADHCETFGTLKTGLPVMITEQGVIRGVPKSEAQWLEFLEKRLGVTRVPTKVEPSRP